ncbi:MAG: YibE/F family protein [Treponema sp.]|nr:YibE/F family protein [Treponema sp.]
MKRPEIQGTCFTVIVSTIFLIVLLLLPTGFESAVQFKDAEKCKALVMTVDNSRIIDTGLIRTGQQICSVRFLDGKFKGKICEGWNMLGGSLAQDKLFCAGDKAQVIVHYEESSDKEGFEILSVNLIDYYRLKGEWILAAAFAVFLVVFAGWTGIRSVLSFAITVLALWKLLIPFYLKGWNPIFCGFLITVFLTNIILALVYGFDRRLLASVFGSLSGILVAAILSVICTAQFKIHGAVMAYSESVLYSGYEYLNLTEIFMSSILIGASGSIMDLSVDITSAVNEVVKKCPEISKIDAVKSGLAVARAAMGTMTTTLLLAYSGSCISLLMAFMAQGTPIYNILNNNQVSAEIINTIAGSFGLASTAPLTALMAGLILPGNSKRQKKDWN